MFVICFFFFPSYLRLWLLRRCFSFSPSALLAERTPRREKWSMESLQSTCKAWNIGSHTFIMGALTASSIFSSCGTCPNSGRMLAAAVDPVKSRGGLSVRDLQGISQRENVRLKLRMYTSSTARGGGGSFKNRKPIGEVGCCESGMAKRIH